MSLCHTHTHTLLAEATGPMFLRSVWASVLELWHIVRSSYLPSKQATQQTYLNAQNQIFIHKTGTLSLQKCFYSVGTQSIKGI